MNIVILVNGLLLVAMAALMGLDALFFPATRGLFAEAALLTGLVGTAVALAVSGRLTAVHRLHAFVMTASVWLTAACAGALPLWLWQLGPTDAFFESMSGITTTGSTVMSGLDETERGVLMWRAVLQWIGGIGFIVTGIALLPILRVGGMQLFRTESSEREKELGSSARFAAATIWVYAALSLLCMVVYIVGGMSPFDAIAHAMTTVSTGGYSTYDASFGHFESGFLECSATLFMLCGALPFAWYIRAANRRIIRSEQVRSLLIGLTAVTFFIAFWRVASAGTPPLETLRHTAFSVVSVVTTTGFATVDYTTWGPPAVVAFFLMTAVGGCTGSTAGGAKMMRWILFVRFGIARTRAVHYPDGIFPIRYEGRPIDPDVFSGVISFFVFYAATVAALALGLNLYGLDFSTSVSGALTAVANVGPGVGEVIGPSGNFASLPEGAKWLLSFGMYAGRLEMLTVLVLLTPRFWEEIR